MDEPETFPCEKCGTNLIEVKPDEWGHLTCPNCGHVEAV